MKQSVVSVLVAGVVGAPLLVVQIWVVNVVARLMHTWGWLDLTWLAEALRAAP